MIPLLSPYITTPLEECKKSASRALLFWILPPVISKEAPSLTRTVPLLVA